MPMKPRIEIGPGLDHVILHQDCRADSRQCSRASGPQKQVQAALIGSNHRAPPELVSSCFVPRAPGYWADERGTNLRILKIELLPELTTQSVSLAKATEDGLPPRPIVSISFSSCGSILDKLRLP